MGAGTLQVTKMLDRIKTVVEALTPFTGRVYQGKKRFSEAENFEETLKGLTAQSQGYFSFWLEHRSCGVRNETTEATVSGIAAIYMPKDTTTDENTCLETMDNLCSALTKESNFSTLGARIKSCDYERVDEEWVAQSIALFVLVIVLELGPFQGE